MDLNILVLALSTYKGAIVAMAVDRNTPNTVGPWMDLNGVVVLALMLLGNKMELPRPRSPVLSHHQFHLVMMVVVWRMEVWGAKMAALCLDQAMRDLSDP